MRTLFILFITYIPAVLYGQDRLTQRGIDSLTKMLASAKQDTNKVSILNELSFQLTENDPDRGIKYATEAIVLSEKLGNQVAMAMGYFCLAGNYQSKAEYPKSLQNYFKALKIYEAFDNKMRICKTLGNIGTLYYSMKNYKEALVYESLALNIATTIGDKASIARNTGNMGAVYTALKDFPKALEYLKLSLKSNEERNYKRGMATNYTNIGALYFKQLDCAMALQNHFKALNLYQETGNKSGTEICLENIGSVYAKIYETNAVRTEPDKLVSANREENLHRAYEYLSQALALAKEIGDLEGVISIAHNQYKTYTLGEDYKKALEAYKEYKTISDSVYSNENMLKMAAEETKREADLKNKEIQINKLATEQKRNERVIFGAGIVLLAFIIIAVYRNYKTQKRVNKIQEEALEQKEMLMREIHHRVKNNLQVISALLDLQLTTVTDSYAKDAITESTTRLKAISLIHHQLYQDKNITTIECAHFATDLHSQINAVFSTPMQTIVLHKEMPDLMLDIDTAVPFGLILNELITNSYKYAFADAPDGRIDVKLEIIGDNNYRLIYHDSGPGLTDSQDITTSKGLGLNIIRSLSKQLGGTFVYDRKTKSFIITFKDLIGRKMTD